MALVLAIATTAADPVAANPWRTLGGPSLSLLTGPQHRAAAVVHLGRIVVATVETDRCGVNQVMVWRYDPGYQRWERLGGPLNAHIENDAARPVLASVDGVLYEAHQERDAHGRWHVFARHLGEDGTHVRWERDADISFGDADVSEPSLGIWGRRPVLTVLEGAPGRGRVWLVPRNPGSFSFGRRENPLTLAVAATARVAEVRDGLYIAALVEAEDPDGAGRATPAVLHLRPDGTTVPMAMPPTPRGADVHDLALTALDDRYAVLAWIQDNVVRVAVSSPEDQRWRVTAEVPVRTDEYLGHLSIRSIRGMLHVAAAVARRGRSRVRVWRLGGSSVPEQLGPDVGPGDERLDAIEPALAEDGEGRPVVAYTIVEHDARNPLERQSRVAVSTFDPSRRR